MRRGDGYCSCVSPFKGLPRQSGGHWLAREKRRRLSGAAALRNK
ncbi:hypothetical protein HMPREF3150_01036 [Pseudomonas aeruginosa]|nr:hypothetical protein HMPREF3150_01036 [Pseudomonas aeruginosa]